MQIKGISILLLIVFVLCQCTPEKSTELGVVSPQIMEPLPETQQVSYQIGVRTVSGISEFYNKVTGQTFVPRGYNYTHVMPLTAPCLVTDFPYHSTFNVGVYDSVEADLMLSALQAAHYNTVRIFLNPECLTMQDGTLNPDYIANLVDFLHLAQTHEQTVIITTDLIPSTRYGEPIQEEEDIWWHNAQYLYEDQIALEVTFWQDFIIALGAQNAPLETILAYELRNELYFHLDYPPINQDQGIVTTANGQTYDMSIPADKARMVAEGVVYWSKQIRDAIQTVDPTALVTVGFFAPEPFGKPSRAAILDSELDFVDLHMYPQEGVMFADYADYFGLDERSEKLLVMGEFGIVESDETVDEAADALQNWQRESCQHNLTGWLLWTWKTKQGVELSVPDDGTIFRTLSPANSPSC